MTSTKHTSRLLTYFMLGAIVVGLPILLGAVQTSTEYRQQAAEVTPSGISPQFASIPQITNSISSESLPSSMTGVAYTATVVGYSQVSSASLIMSATSYDGATGLPASLKLGQCVSKIDSLKRSVITCRISGTPSLAEKGTYAVPITITDTSSNVATTKQYILSVGDGIILRPYIGSLNEINVAPGGVVTILGADFGVNRGGVNFYRVGLTSASSGGVVTSWSDNLVTVTLPTSLTPSSDYMVEVVSSDNRRSPQKLYHIGP